MGSSEEANLGTGADQLETWQQERIHTVLENYGWVGVELRSIASGEASVHLPCPPDFNVGGQFNGGVLSGLLEVPSFLALLTELREGETPVTNDIFVQHLRGVPADAEIILEGRLVKRGRSMAWTEARALADGKITTLARITKTILAG
jgi:acyl-coenzyme A thioesterase PaaI-like protein